MVENMPMVEFCQGSQLLSIVSRVDRVSKVGHPTPQLEMSSRYSSSLLIELYVLKSNELKFLK